MSSTWAETRGDFEVAKNNWQAGKLNVAEEEELAGFMQNCVLTRREASVACIIDTD